MKTILGLAAAVVLISFTSSAHAICESMSNAKAQLAVDLINTQIAKSPEKLGRIETSVSFRNIKKAIVVKTASGFSQVGLETTYTNKEMPYALLDLGNSYLKLEGTTQAVNLGYLTTCNISGIQKIGYASFIEVK